MPWVVRDIQSTHLLWWSGCPGYNRCLRVQPRWSLHCSILCQLLMWYVTCTRCATHFCMALSMAIQQVGTPGQLKNTHFLPLYITWLSVTSVLSVSPHTLASHSSLLHMWSTIADCVLCVFILYTALFHVVSNIDMSLLYIWYIHICKSYTPGTRTVARM